MLSLEEFQILKNALAQKFIVLSDQCIVLRAKDVFGLIEYFIQEKEDGIERGEKGKTEQTQVEAGVEQEPSGEDSGTIPSESTV